MNASQNNHSFLFLLSLSRQVDAQVCCSGHHSAHVAYWAESMAHCLRFGVLESKAICQAALLHDIGKVIVPAGVLSKSGPLTDDEWCMMKVHPVVGATIVSATPELAGVAPYIHCHQEKFDGSGYPAGLSGESIPFGARLLAVIDAYEAMTSDRYYRKSLGHEYALQELRHQSGCHFDPQAVATFLDVIEKN
jgi:putative nucleotidyltransferase with HDIG domain